MYSAIKNLPKDKKYRIAIIIDTAIAIPPTTGVTYRLYYLSLEMIKRGHEILWILGNRNFKSEKNLEELSGTKIRTHLLPNRLFYDAEYVAQILIEEKVDLVQYEIAQTFVSLGAQIRHLTKLPTLLELHDVEATIHNLLGEDEEVPLSKFIQYIAGESADAIVSMTPMDYKTLIDDLGIQKDKMFLAPNGVNVGEFDEIIVDRSENTLLFLGNLFYPPNQKGFIYAADELLPELSKNRSVTLKSIGMVPGSLKEKYKNHRNIEFMGEIKDKAEFISELKSSTIGLCTVFAGSGMKVKILDYSMAGLPVVSTKIGISGYENVDSIIVQDDKEKIVAEILKILEDKIYAERLGTANKERVSALYGWPSVAEKIESALALADNFNMKKMREEKFKPLWLEEGRHEEKVLDSHYVIDKNKIYEK